MNDPKKDVIVMYMAPWCGHCKKLKPVWQALAQSLEGTSVVVAMINNDEIRQEIVPVKGFPTVAWFKSDNKNHEIVNQRSLEGL